MPARRGGSQVPQSLQVRAIRRALVHRNWRGIDVIAKWPRKRGKRATPAQAEARQQFKSMVRMVNQLPIDYQVWARDTANLGGQYTWRDYLSRFVSGQGVVEVNGLLTITTQAALDTMGSLHGMTLYRAELGWVALPRGNPDDVLTIVGEYPSWQPASGGGGGGLSVAQTAAMTTTHNLAVTTTTYQPVPELAFVVGPFNTPTIVLASCSVHWSGAQGYLVLGLDGALILNRTAGFGAVEGNARGIVPMWPILVPGDAATHTIQPYLGGRANGTITCLLDSWATVAH